jgi:hypothetical protein
MNAATTTGGEADAHRPYALIIAAAPHSDSDLSRPPSRNTAQYPPLRSPRIWSKQLLQYTGFVPRGTKGTVVS